MAAITICSDFGAPQNKVWHCSHCFPIYFPWSMGPDAMIFVFWMLSFKGFSVVNEAEDVFLEFSCFFYDPTDVGNLISGSFAFSNISLNIRKFTVHVLPGSIFRKLRVMASGPITSWELDGETVETIQTLFLFLGSKITSDGDCSHEIKWCLLLGRKVMTNLDSIFKNRDTALPTKVCLVKAMVFPVVMYGCES